MSHSSNLFSRAQTVIPGGVNSPVRAFKSVGGNPLFFQQGVGAHLIDVDQKTYIDYVNSWGCLILGHAHPRVIEAVNQTVQNGLGFGAPTPGEVEMAELLTTLVPSMDQVRLVNSGTEATQSAIRLARGTTQRNKILKFVGCYHGHTDALLVKSGSGLLTYGIPDSAGVPNDSTRHTLLAPYNDLEAARALFKQYGQDIAAIIVEPVTGNMNCILPLPGFLVGLRTLCDEHESLLIFDEVITGFRVAQGGAQAHYKINPDLTCLGKIIGGGLPVGAFGGKKAIMDNLAPNGPVYQAGTLSGNPVTVAAGVATLRELNSDVYQQLSASSKRLTQSLKSLATQYSIPLQTRCIGGMFGLFFTENETIQNLTHVEQCNQKHFKQFFHGMLKKGVFLAPSTFEIGFISTAHSPALLERTLEAAESVFKTWTSDQSLRTAEPEPLYQVSSHSD